MQNIDYKNKQLYVEELAVSHLAEQYGTPCYIYSQNTLKENWQAFADPLKAYPHLICYAVKANSNLAVLNTLAQLGAGFDIVSVGELERVLAAGGSANKIVFSGVGKQYNELKRALELGIYCFNVESAAELQRLNQVALSINTIAPVSLRINPDVAADTHPYITTGLEENKFGISNQEALAAYLTAAKLEHIQIKGIDCHIGSQLTDVSPFLAALDKLLALIDELAKLGIAIEHLDLGGGLGISYNDEAVPTIQEYLALILDRLKNRTLKLILEPGRALVGNAGILVTRVEYIKASSVKNFAIVDAGMNDLLRPALYSAWQKIMPVMLHEDRLSLQYDVVGPVCETSDFLGKDRALAISEGDLLAIRDSGAYGFTMSSNYNTRPRAAEIMVSGNVAKVVRRRERISDLYAGESIFE